MFEPDLVIVSVTAAGATVSKLCPAVRPADSI
jgi:hypothetical protein